MSRLPITLLAVLATSSARAVDFDTDIVPVFTKSGCNAGSCHGAAAGRGGFKLSLLGGDPAADYDAVVFERKGRRVNLAKPSDSLILLKPTGDLPHEGGIRLEDGSAGEKRLLDWITSGAPRPKASRKLTHFEIGPADFVAGGVGIPISLSATGPVRQWQTRRRHGLDRFYLVRPVGGRTRHNRIPGHRPPPRPARDHRPVPRPRGAGTHHAAPRRKTWRSFPRAASQLH